MRGEFQPIPPKTFGIMLHCYTLIWTTLFAVKVDPPCASKNEVVKSYECDVVLIELYKPQSGSTHWVNTDSLDPKNWLMFLGLYPLNRMYVLSPIFIKIQRSI